MDRTDFSPFNASSRSWGTAQATDPHLVAEINLLRETICNVGIFSTGSVTLATTAAELRSFSGFTNKKLAYVLYLETEDGGGGGWFRYDTSVSSDDDSYDVLKPATINTYSPGRWVRIP